MLISSIKKVMERRSLQRQMTLFVLSDDNLRRVGKTTAVACVLGMRCVFFNYFQKIRRILFGDDLKPAIRKRANEMNLFISYKYNFF